MALRVAACREPDAIALPEIRFAEPSPPPEINNLQLLSITSTKVQQLTPTINNFHVGSTT
jgi:hypothetical protein